MANLSISTGDVSFVWLPYVMILDICHFRMVLRSNYYLKVGAMSE